MNLYAYAGNNPVAFSDPWGLCPPWDTNDGPHCPGTQGATLLTAGELRGAAEKAARDAQAHPLKQVIGAIQDFVGRFRDMKHANTIGGDKYFHCLANCEAAQRGPAGTAAAGTLSDLRELTDQVRGTSADSSVADQAANAQGRSVGGANPLVPCKAVCYTQRPRGLPEKY